MRKLARIVEIDAIRPIDGADAIEVAMVGGWAVVVKKNEFRVGARAVYFEIDSFLPEGRAEWQFLVDKSAREYEGRRGHVLRSIKLRGQVSQGLLLPVSMLPPAAQRTESLGADVTELLGVVKYEPPIPVELGGDVRGLFPSRVPKTDQERIQNLAAELAAWREAELRWEVSEKLEGMSCTLAWLDQELHVCSRNLDLKETPGHSMWQVARDLDLAAKLGARFPDHDIAFQGELIGPGIQGNIYGLKRVEFRLFDVYDVRRAGYLNPAERLALAQAFGIAQVPILSSDFSLKGIDMAALLDFADGPSALKPAQLREGVVFKRADSDDNIRLQPGSFKVISNRYLLKQG